VRPTPQDLALLARCAQVVYLEPNPCRDRGAELGLDVLCLFETETECFVTRAGDRQLVVFRGTEPNQVEDWLSDLKLRRRIWPAGVPDFGAGRVHRGFADAGDLIHRRVLQALDPGRPVLVSGHSLGGAIATYFAARLLLEHPDRYPLAGGLTVGCPRVGNEAFADWFAGRVGDSWVRAVHNNDVVTRVPLSTWGFRHAATPVAWIGYDGEISWDPELWDRFKDRLCGRVEALTGRMDVREVPGVDAGVYRLLNEKGMAALRHLLEPAAVGLLVGYGVPPLVARRLVDWAADRSHGGTVFDGLHDHASELYARAFERAAQVV
jgi:triacylglycerol lipase